MGIDNTEIAGKILVTLYVEMNDGSIGVYPGLFVGANPSSKATASALRFLPKLLTETLEFEPPHSKHFQWVKDVNEYLNRYTTRESFTTSDIKRLCKRSRDILYWHGFGEAAYDRIVALQTAAGAGKPKSHASRTAKDDIIHLQEVKSFIASATPAALISRGDDYYSLMGMYDFATYCYEAAFAEAPEPLGLREKIGLAYHARDNHFEAEKWLQSAMDLERYLGVPALQALGSILSKSRRLSEAEEVYKFGLELGHVAVSRADLVKVLELQGNLVEARSHLDQACRDGEFKLDRDLDAHKPFFELGQLCVKLGDIEAAESAFRSAISGGNRYALIELAQLLELRGQYIEAVECRTEFSERSAAMKSKRRRRR